MAQEILDVLEIPSVVRHIVQFLEFLERTELLSDAPECVSSFRDDLGLLQSLSTGRRRRRRSTVAVDQLRQVLAQESAQLRQICSELRLKLLLPRRLRRACR